MVIAMYQDIQEQNQVSEVYLTALIVPWYNKITMMMYQKKEKSFCNFTKEKKKELFQVRIEFIKHSSFC